jgi:Sugar (and other) transporter
MRIRAKGVALSTMTNWLVSTVLGQVSPIGLANSSWRYYILFVVMNFLSAILNFLFFPETKGKTLEQMDELFGDQQVEHALEKGEQGPEHLEETAGSKEVISNV